MPFFRIDAYAGRNQDEVKELLNTIHRRHSRHLLYRSERVTRHSRSIHAVICGGPLTESPG